MKILFLTTHSLATNPRLVKEIFLAINKRYEVSVIAFSFKNWSEENNERIKRLISGKVDYTEIQGNRKPFWPWLLSTIIFRYSTWMLKFFPDNFRMISWASNKRSFLLWRYLRNFKGKPDWVIAHNIGGLYPALQFAKSQNSLLGIDLEDYHPGETNNENVSKEIIQLLRGTIPNAIYVTAASPLIMEETESVIHFNNRKEVILNYFSASEFLFPNPKVYGPLRLIWFSQNISFNRGLEQILPIIEELEDVELDLFGNCNEEFYDRWLKDKKNICINRALPQKEIHQLLSEYDAGLAIEPGKDRNNELAISNKILAYFQAGLYIIGSDTPAQKKFLKENPHCGIVVSLFSEGLAERLAAIIASKDSIRRTKAGRFRNARQFNWEKESEKLVKLWEGLHPSAGLQPSDG